MTNASIQPIHFTDSELTDRVNPVLVNLIGVGGTGGHVLDSLADMNEVLTSLGHPGLEVRVFDEDTVSVFNLGRQRFTRAEVGLPKAAAKINRINRNYGTYWKAMLYPYALNYEHRLQEFLPAQITISCVDSVKSRFEIETILDRYCKQPIHQNVRDKPIYWIDFGNSRYTGQVILSTLRKVRQPKSELYQPVSTLPLFTKEFRNELQAVDDTNEPSCSMEEALSRQDLFINPILAFNGCRLLWALISQGMTTYRGVFVNVKDYKTIPIPITAEIPPNLVANYDLLPNIEAA